LINILAWHRVSGLEKRTKEKGAKAITRVLPEEGDIDL
jgi:hypothetical protein